MLDSKILKFGYEPMIYSLGYRFMVFVVDYFKI